MTVTDAQVRKMNEEYTKDKNLSVAALRSGMDRKTARRYRDAGKLPSELKKPRTWRTRTDPFEEDWQELAAMLEDAPELEAKTLFEYLVERQPGRYQPGQVRTLQRRVREWRARQGPPKEVFFPQRHRPGEAAQTDFTWATELGVTIAGEPFAHMLCHFCLPYSDWSWATICFSESIAALREGVQNAVFRLGRVPEWHQTDNSSSATHRVDERKRKFNDDYVSLLDHLGMQPRTIVASKKEQNGSIEAMNGALKRRLKQHLLIRGHRDFDSVEEYRAWLEGVLEKANAAREAKVKEELAAMKAVRVERLPSHTELRVRVTKWSTIRVKHNTYSVPSRLIDEQVRVHVYDDRLEVFHGSDLQLSMPRLHGRNGHRINYRHVIWSLVQKPGAFERYRYRDDLFPSAVFRRAYDALGEALSQRRANIAYLKVLHLAASTMESDVEVALECLLDEGLLPGPDSVKLLVEPPKTPEVPELRPFEPDLASYDALVCEEGVR